MVTKKKGLDRNVHSKWVCDGELVKSFFIIKNYNNGFWKSEKQAKFMMKKGMSYTECKSKDPFEGWLAEFALENGIKKGQRIISFTQLTVWGDVITRTRTNITEHIFLFDKTGLLKYWKRSKKGVELVWERK